MLFAHAALALSGCAGGWRAPAEAVAAAGTMPCCLESDTGSGVIGGNANLCVAHCTADAQSVDSSGQAVPPVPTSGGLSESVISAPGLFVLRRPVAAPTALPAPPRTILFKNFRI